MEAEKLDNEEDGAGESGTEGSTGTVGSAGSARPKKKINPIDQAKLDYILGILMAKGKDGKNSSKSEEIKEEEVEPPKILAAWF